MFENRHGKRSGGQQQGNNDHNTYYHVEAKGHLDILERPEELRLRLDVLKESEQRLEEEEKRKKQKIMEELKKEDQKKRKMMEEIKKDQGIFSILDFFNTLKQQEENKLEEGFDPVETIPVGTITMETVDK